jgi:hypothetical protein
VTSFEIEAIELNDVSVTQLTLLADRDGHTLTRWAEHMATAARELTTAGVLMSYGDTAVLSLTAVWAGEDERRAAKAVAGLRGVGLRLLDQATQRIPYARLVPTTHLHPNVGQQPSTTTNGLLRTMTPAAARAITAAATGRTPSLIQLRSVGGAINDVAAGETAYAHRDHQVLVIATVFPPHGAAALDRVWHPIAGHTDGAYVNFASRLDAAAFRRFYPGVTGERVLDVWRRYDPDGVFRSALYQDELC